MYKRQTWNGSTYTNSGTYTYSTTNALGCDSTATLNLIVNYPSTSSTNVTACSSYTWNGSTYTTSGTYTYSTTNALGCDSTANLNLTVNYPSTSTANVTACSSYTWNGSTYTTSGTYTYSTLNALGCDSTVTLNLIINHPTTSTLSFTACNSYLWNGITYTTSGTYTFSTLNAIGCDSTATLNLTINLSTSSTTTASICEGVSYTFNGISYTTSGTYLAFLTNSVGCDSVATLILTVNPLPVLSVIGGNNRLCATTTTLLMNTQSGGTWNSADNSIASIDNTGLLSAISFGSTVITYSYTDIKGCNSMVMKSVTIDSTPAIPTVVQSGLSTICNSWGSITLTSSADAVNQWYKNNVLIAGQTNQIYKPLSSGNYTVVTNYGNGCFATSAPVPITVNMPVTPEVSALGNTAVCLGNCVRLSSSSGYSTYQWFKDGVQITNADNLDLFACGTGNYYVLATDGTGCQSDTSNRMSVTVSSVAQPVVQSISGVSAVCPGDSTVLADVTPGGIWTVDSTLFATVDSITGLVKGLVQGSAIVSYTVGTLVLHVVLQLVCHLP